MMPDEIRRRLTTIIAKTKGAENVEVPAWWGDERADEQRVMDDLRSGRLAWRDAQRTARWGLEALVGGETERAEEYLSIATDWYIKALESRIEPSDLDFLSRSARRRGRPKKASK